MDQHLIAILYADIKEYSLHMQRDEAGTIDQLKRLRVCLDSTIASHNGRVANTAGDSVVVEFASVKEAVNCAVVAQRAMGAINTSLPVVGRLYFRIGIHLGDIVRNGADILGDGVNIAARIQGLADPGGISLSAAVYDSVRNKLPYHFVPLGEQRLKNIERPLTIYKVQLDAFAALPRESTPLMSRIARYAALAAVLVGPALFYVLRSDPEPTQLATTLVPTNAAPEPAPLDTLLPNSIAVLPFENFSPNTDDAYFAAGIHDEILNQLAKIGQLTVIARTTMRQYENTTKTIPEIARELKVKTVMEGSIRYADGRVRVTTQLIDATTDAHLWSETYEREFTDIFAIESAIAMEVARAMSAEFTQEEEAALRVVPTSSPEAYTLYLGALTDLEQRTADSIVAGTQKIDQALVLDPGFTQGWILKSALYRRVPAFEPELAETSRTIAEQAARRAVELAPNSHAARGVLAAMLTEAGRWADAEAEYLTIPADKRNDSFASSHAWHQFAVGLIRESESGWQEALVNNPLHMEMNYFYAAFRDALGDTNGSIEAYTRGAALFDNWPNTAENMLAWTYLGSGDIQGLASLVAQHPAPVIQEVLLLLETPATAAAQLVSLVESGKYSTRLDLQVLVAAAASLNQPALALEMLEPMIRDLPTNAIAFWRPVMANVRRHPGFKTLVTQTGHVDYWRQYGWPEFCQPVGADDFECN